MPCSVNGPLRGACRTLVSIAATQLADSHALIGNSSLPGRIEQFHCQPPSVPIRPQLRTRELPPNNVGWIDRR